VNETPFAASLETATPSQGVAVAPFLAASSLVKAYGKRRVVDGVSLTVTSGEVVGLLGPNGAGKTTTFNIIVGLTRPDDGVVRLNSSEVTKLPMHLRARLGVGYLPQEASVFRRMRVRDNLIAVMELLGVPRAERESRTEALLAEFGLTQVAGTLGEQLSGGERRRLEIARALVPNPLFLLLDEPFAGIDPIAVADVQQQIARLRERNIGVLLTDHNVRDALSICDRAYILSDGKVLEHGTPTQIAASPRARAVYLGERFHLD
jgi:lipopolysaccharide export system ATP-binding protein